MGRDASGKWRMTSSLVYEAENYSDESHFFAAGGGPVLFEFSVHEVWGKSVGPVRRKLIYVSRVLTARKLCYLPTECIYVWLFCMISNSMLTDRFL